MAADDRAKFLRDAEKYVLQGKIQPAIAEYLKIIKLDPNDVLTLNTIGDLYLRQGKALEANKCFSQVAENYVRNNYFLKAIAVYKKILNADPRNLEVNLTVASLYAKQNLNIDARHQFLRVADILEKEDRIQELMETYVKIVELDPQNAAIQRKLAELYLAEGSQEKARVYFTGAARAQMKSGDLPGAMDSFTRALRINPVNAAVLKDFLACCLQKGDSAPALKQLQISIELAPDNIEIREFLGRAYMAGNDLESAARAFNEVFSSDQSRYQGFFDLAQAFAGIADYSQAASCLDPIIPTLISRRETEQVASVYELILASCPQHLTALTKAASLYSATEDLIRYQAALDKLADCYLSNHDTAPALECLEKILHLNPDSEKHCNLHRQVFIETFPDTPYVSPAAALGRQSEPGNMALKNAAAIGVENAPEIVEADLLLNYGMRDKARSLLQDLVKRNPSDKEARIRLLALFKEEGKLAEAAEECLLLAILFRKLKNEEVAEKYMAEARQLSPEIAANEPDFFELARRHGIPLESLAGVLSGGPKLAAEVDLSGDLLEIFFKGDQNAAAIEEQEEPEAPLDAIAEGFLQTPPVRPPAESVQEQLKEADFYIRLGFGDEAKAKLDEIAKISPDNPELLLLYSKLGEAGLVSPNQEAIVDADKNGQDEAIQAYPAESQALFDDLGVDDALSHFGENLVQDAGDFAPPNIPETPADVSENVAGLNIEWPQSPDCKFPDFAASAATEEDLAPLNIPEIPADISEEAAGSELPQSPDLKLPATTASDAPMNEMFADLIAEVSSLADQENSQEAFEDHFSLGTAYRDMDLLDDAIKEFQIALKVTDPVKDSKKMIQCCGMLSACYLKKEMPRSAVRWCQAGLEAAGISSYEAMALRYDMGVAQKMAGSNERALECFEKIFSLDSSYRDVAQKIDELRAPK